MLNSIGTATTHCCPSLKGLLAIDISKLRDQTGLITLDSGYGNTGSCQSAITFIDGEKGHPALPRHSDRGAGRAIDFRRDCPT